MGCNVYLDRKTNGMTKINYMNCQVQEPDIDAKENGQIKLKREWV